MHNIHTVHSISIANTARTPLHTPRACHTCAACIPHANRMHTACTPPGTPHACGVQVRRRRLLPHRMAPLVGREPHREHLDVHRECRQVCLKWPLGTATAQCPGLLQRALQSPGGLLAAPHLAPPAAWDAWDARRSGQGCSTHYRGAPQPRRRKWRRVSLLSARAKVIHFAARRCKGNDRPPHPTTVVCFGRKGPNEPRI